jgi:protein SCO1/2
MSTRVWTIILCGLLFAGGIFAGLQFVNRPPAMPELQIATYMPTGRPLQAFQLTADDGSTLRSADLAGDWTIVFMGFTNCGHVCPMTLFTVSEALQKLHERPEVLFVSVDPGRDTPERIAKYVAGFDPAFRGATGDKAQLDRLAESLGAPYLVSTDNDRYTVDHSGALFLIDPAGRFRALLSPPHDAEVIAADLSAILVSG